MPTFTPTISVSTPPLIITMAGTITYEEFVFMLGVLNLNVREFFLESQDRQQLDNNLSYSILDSTGIIQADTLKPRKDPFQRQNSLVLVPEKGSVLLNGLSSVSFNIEPLASISFTLCVDQVDPTTLAPGETIDNFILRQNDLDNYTRFTNMKTCL